jgi:hypothetical protein
MKSIEEIWQSEESMAEAYKEILHLSKFDRTMDASKLVNRLVDNEVMMTMNGSPLYYDKRIWILQHIQDFNIATQLLLNCQEGSVHFNVDKLKDTIDGYREAGAGDTGWDPFDKKAKFLEGDDVGTKAHNRILSDCRNSKILSAAMVGFNSFRVSPIGSTPAFADLNNLSNLSIMGLSQIVGSDVKIWMLNHKAIQDFIHVRQQEDGGTIADGLVYPIYSKSGGDILLRALTSRWVAYQALSERFRIYVVPKYDSLLTVGDDLPEGLKEFVSEFKD